MPAKGVLVGAVLLSAAILVVAWIWNQRSDTARSSELSGIGSSLSGDEGRGVLASSPPTPTDKAILKPGTHRIAGDTAPSETGAVHTPEEGLRDFFGGDWERLRPLYAKRIPLDAALPGRLVPWPEVAGQVCARMRVSDEDCEQIRRQYSPVNPVTAEALRSRYHVEETVIRDDDLLEIEALLQEPRSQLEGIITRFRRVIDMRLASKCVAGEFDHAPYSNVENMRLPKRTVFLSTFAISDWVVTYGVSPDEDPELPTLVKELKACGDSARELIHNYFAERR